MRPHTLGYVLAALVSGLVVASSVGAGVGRWGPSAGPEGGWVSAIAIDPSASSVLYAATAHGVFKTTDSGETWTPVATGPESGSVAVLAVDPRRPTVVYAGAEGGRVLKSSDGGATWRVVGKATLRVGWVSTLAIDPLDTETLYAGGHKGLSKSTDGGRSWRLVSTGLTRRVVGAIAVDPLNPSTLFVGASSPSAGPMPGSLFKSTDGGAGWREVLTGLRGGVCGIAVDPADPATLYAGDQSSEGGGLFKSVDGGESWARLSADGCASLAVDFTRTPNVLYVGSSSSLGPLRSVDGGRSWVRIGKTLPEAGWSYHKLVLDPRRPATLYATAGDFGVYRTTSGGDPWQSSNRGLVGRRIRSLAVHPREGRTLYAGTAGGIQRSTDGGGSWDVARLSSVWVDAIAIDPLRPSRIYVGGSRGVYRSTDGGRSWTRSAASVLRHGATALALDPKDPSTVYARAADVWLDPSSWRLVTSTDAGRSWRVLKPGLRGRWVSSITVDPRDTRMLYAATMPLYRDERLVGGGVFRSTDGGRTWRAAGLSKAYVGAVAVDPAMRGSVYAATDGGVFTSTDGARTWSRPTLRCDASDLVLDPSSAATVYAACRGKGVFRSSDGARSWRPFNAGLTVPDVLRLGTDATGRTLYAGTEAGVFDYRFPR